MTPVSTFETELRQAMTILRDGLPNAAILTSSIVDVYRLWEIGHTSFEATSRWAR